MENKMNFKFLLLFIISIIILCIGMTCKSLQNDTFYMIKLGDYIFHHGIDLKDHWVWMLNLSYTYPHWLYDLFIYIIYNYFGYNGIYISNILLYIILILIIFYINININNNKFLAYFISLISIILLSFGITARAQVLTYILFLLEVFYILKLINNGKKKNIFMLVLFSILIANIHATVWLFYFILFLPFIGEQIIYFLVKKYNIKVNKKLIINKINNFDKLVLSFILSFIGGLLSPSKICYTYVFRIMMGDSQLYINEHAPLVLIKNPLFIGLILVLLIVLIFTKTKIKLNELFMIGGLSLMSLMSSRHIIFFYLIGVLFISIIIMRYFTESKDYTLDILYNIIINNNIIYALIFVIVIVCGVYSFNYNNKYDYIDKKEYPIKAVKYIKDNLDYKHIKLFNTYNYGSYIMYNDIPVFIDSRCDLYLKEFNGKVSIFDEVVTIKGNYKDILDKYGVEYALVKNDDFLYELLIRDFKNVEYHDKYFTLFKIS